MTPYLIEIHSSSGTFVYRFRGDQIRDVCGIVQHQWKSGLLRGLAFQAVCHELENVIDMEAWEEKRRQRVREIAEKPKPTLTQRIAAVLFGIEL